MNNRFLAVVVTISVLITLVACGTANNPVDPLEIGDPERGRDIFVTGGDILMRACAHCHNLEGDTIERHAPTMVGIAETAGTRIRGLSAEEYLRQSILDPSAFIVEGYEENIQMEGFYELLLSEDDIDALVAFLLTQ